MSNNIIKIGSVIEIIFSVKNENNETIFGETDGKKIKIELNENMPLFDLFKCIIGKEIGYSGKIKVNKININEKIEELSIESLPSYLDFKKNTIIQIGSNHKKYGFIKDIENGKLILETSKPFRNITSILDIKIIKVD